MQESKPVLLVEDDSVNAIAVRRTFGGLKIPKHLVHLKSGEEALEYLSDESKEKPALILLDLNMMGMNGIEFLRKIKGDPILRSIPVVMFTTSDDERDIAECFDLNVAGYMVKPHNHELFTEIIGTIVKYWDCSKLPNEQDDHANQRTGISGNQNLPDNVILVKLPYDRPEREEVLKATNEEADKREDCDVVLDLYKTEIITSCEISNLLILHNMLKKSGRKLVLCNVAKESKYILVAVGLRDVFCIVDDMTSALETLSSVDSHVGADSQ